MREEHIHYSTAIIGAGPYGLAIAARLKAAKTDFVLLGRPMGFWRESVPCGTRLLSTPASCSLSDTEFDYRTYANGRGRARETMAGNDLVDYCLWFQRKACGDSVEQEVVELIPRNGAYGIRLANGSEIVAGRVVIAIGLKPFATIPTGLAGLRGRAMFHTSDLRDLSGFSGKKIIVIGSGQSAVDCAALLLEQNADVEVVARANELNWKGSPLASANDPHVRRRWTARGAVRDFLYEPSVFNRLPTSLRARILRRVLVPSADRTLMARVNQIRFTLGRKVLGACLANEKVKLHLDDQSTRMVDYVVAGTGYRINVDGISFLSRELRSKIRTRDGFPLLNSRMETSAAGLYITGAPAAWNFGPYMWFIRGAAMAAKIASKDLVRGTANLA